MCATGVLRTPRPGSGTRATGTNKNTGPCHTSLTAHGRERTYRAYHPSSAPVPPQFRPSGKLPCATGTHSTRQAGTRYKVCVARTYSPRGREGEAGGGVCTCLPACRSSPGRSPAPEVRVGVGVSGGDSGRGGTRPLEAEPNPNPNPFPKPRGLGLGLTHSTPC